MTSNSQNKHNPSNEHSAGDVLSSICQPVIPVVIISKISDALPLAEALLNGGIDVIEITLRSDCALECIALIRKQLPDMLTGAGTLLTQQDVEKVVAAGAQFAVSPGLSASIVASCNAKNLPLLPGVATSSEIMQARDLGLHFLKFFPAEAAGGIPLIKSWASPFADVVFCPTGGVRAETAAEYLALPNVRCVGGTWIAPAELIEAGNWAEITSRAKAASILNESKGGV